MRRARTEYQVTYALSRMQAEGADTAPVEFDATITVIEVTLNHNDKIPLQQVPYEATAKIIMDKDNLQRGQQIRYLQKILTTLLNRPILSLSCRPSTNGRSRIHCRHKQTGRPKGFY